MLQITNGKYLSCDGVSRRSFLKAGVLGLTGLTLGDMLRRLIVGTASQLQPGQSQLSECPPGEQADRMCREPPTASLGGEPIPDRRTAPIQANLMQGDAAGHHVLVARLGQRSCMLATSAARQARRPGFG